MPLYNRTATIIGASGYVGRSLKSRLEKSEWAVITPGKGDEHHLYGQHLGTLFYCAGMTANYLENPAKTVRAHTCLIAELLEKTYFNNIVYLSSTRLSDIHGSNNVILPYAKRKEVDDLMLNPINVRHLFDLTKAAGEAVCLAIGQDKATIARLSCIWDLKIAKTGFLASLISRIKSSMLDGSREIIVDAEPHILRHYLHLDDLITALIRMAEFEHDDRIIALASDEKPTTNKELFGCLESHSGCTFTYTQAVAPLNFMPPELNLNSYRNLLQGLPSVPAFIDDLGQRMSKLFNC
jgi:UDP-glucose 4-epimerase